MLRFIVREAFFALLVIPDFASQAGLSSDQSTPDLRANQENKRRKSRALVLVTSITPQYTAADRRLYQDGAR
jgi:hypothetical protein